MIQVYKRRFWIGVTSQLHNITSGGSRNETVISFTHHKILDEGRTWLWITCWMIGVGGSSNNLCTSCASQRRLHVNYGIGWDHMLEMNVILRILGSGITGLIGMIGGVF
ncbi:hypothetical protein K492DRAFT_181792 [Lichtheimia hyalospora FSU 10163]|nr:hypothetical protein K492DRAFT_181792 [Lichtheimia hyalospora FSU 10163]